MAERRLVGLLRRPGRAAGGGTPPLAAAFRAVFEASPEGHALLDAEGRILLGNSALARMAGAAVPVTPGAPVERLVAPPARAALLAHLAAARAGEAPPLHAAPADPAAVADAEWALQARPVLAGGPGAAPPLLLLAVTDRTEQHRAAQRLAASARLETVGRLAGGIAHDFNNLLTAVLGAAAAARDAGLNDAAAAELAQIEDAARRGAGLVRQVLAFARQQPMRPRVIDLRQAVEDSAALLRRLMGRRIALELAMEADAAPVHVDPAQLDQVLMNLAANAKEAMPEGGRLRVTVGRAVVLRREGEGPEALPPGRYAVLEVADTGFGIPPDVLPRLFEPFFTTRPDRGGTGLGLATVQGIVAQCGGQIAVASTPGEGTVFRIHLPRVDALPEAVPAAAVAPVTAAPMMPSRGTGALLLVEDEAPLRRLSARVLERAGYQVRVAESAEAALELLEETAEPPVALVSDVAMPGIDGLALARQLRARWPGLPVLLLSGYAEAVLGEDLAGAGMGFLAKPFDPAELVAQLASLFDGGTASAGR
ncbi:MAG: response regulator [Acetobacteraceae bacterium]|nr:response regulator [Acetobacteraceae bacterium]